MTEKCNSLIKLPSTILKWRKLNFRSDMFTVQLMTKQNRFVYHHLMVVSYLTRALFYGFFTNIQNASNVNKHHQFPCYTFHFRCKLIRTKSMNAETNPLEKCVHQKKKEKRKKRKKGALY